MNKTIDRLKWIFLSAFMLSCAAVVAYQIYYVRPRDACEALQNWWDPQTRICAVPISLSALTGRPNKAKPPTAPKPQASPKPDTAKTKP